MGAEAVARERVHALAAPADDDELVAVALDWARRGEAEGDLVVAAVLPWLAEHLRAALPGVEVAELCAPTPRGPEGIAWQLAVHARAQAEGRRLRVVGQVLGDDRRGWDECVRSEAAYEHILGRAHTATLCLYDRRTPSDVLDEALRVHPHRMVGGRVVDNAGHVEPATFVSSLGVPAEPVQQGEPVLAIDDAPSLADLRHALATALRGRLGHRDADDDVHLAASEIAANAFRHGVRPVSARVWASAQRVVVSISDGGQAFVGPLAGYRPAHGDDLSRGGMGLWLARKLCDHVDLEQTERGLTVRLTTAVRRPA
ncbi:Anti-sigma regulatory factor (Ser/Thr protein kinase) [Klenkia marina]|uniref:Anti-sigma regulatory factor (Ser/Thr protein kinase) n=1 Tax=Klenkia marina TaxID=1960309 RepID=A0A1G4YXT9_9ACTN|nr:sensor histidine kinase [Klenkia marina]SCX58105.1 Anti-sigma regulatory factor (Ser/Thr protein kinase) [Klenkia marina]